MFVKGVVCSESAAIVKAEFSSGLHLPWVYSALIVSASTVSASLMNRQFWARGEAITPDFLLVACGDRHQDSTVTELLTELLEI